MQAVLLSPGLSHRGTATRHGLCRQFGSLFLYQAVLQKDGMSCHYKTNKPIGTAAPHKAQNIDFEMR